MKTALETLGTKDQKHRLSLASLLSMYPQDWVTRYVDKLEKTTMRNAKDISSAVGPGLRPAFETPVERNRRYGLKEEFLSLWLQQAENVEHSPEIKRLRSGELVKESIKYRILNGHKGYEKCSRDAKNEGYPVYSQSHLCIRQDELGLVDPKSDAGLCPNEALGAGMERPLHPREFDSSREDYPDTGIVSQQDISRSVDTCFRLVRGESAMHGLVHRHVVKTSLLSGSFSQSSGGTKAYKVGEDRSILIRHKFGSQWFVLGCHRGRKILDELAEYIMKMMIPNNRTGPGTTISERILALVMC
jgi:hypothetical protein